MNRIYIKSVFLAFLALLVIAPTSMGFGVSGAVFKGDVSPGQELVHEISVSNDVDSAPQNMVAEVYGFAMNENGANVELSPGDDTGPYSARSFLSVEPNSFVLEPGERKTLLLTGTVPEDVGSGGRYALVSIKTMPKGGGGNIRVSTAIQVLVLLTIKDSELVQTGEITDLVASKSDEGVAVDLIFENSGNVHYRPFVGVVLKNEDGEVLAEEMPAQISSSILPTNSRLVKMTLVPKADLDPGIYTVEATVSLEDGTLLDSEEATVSLEDEMVPDAEEETV